MWKFTFEVQGVPQFNRAFNRVTDHIEDLREVWDEVQPVFYKIEEEQFKSEGTKGGARWKTLSPAYAKRKAKLYPGKPILQASGRMYEALTGQSGDSRVIKTKTEFAVGTSLSYPMMHQTGGKKLPKRPPVNFGESQKREIQKATQKGLLEILRRDPAIRSTLDFER